MTANRDRAAEVTEQPMTANEVRAARAAYGLTCAELAHILDVNERTVRRWESHHPALPNGRHAAEIRAIDAHIDHLAESIARGAPEWNAPPGMARVAQWRAHLQHGTRTP